MKTLTDLLTLPLMIGLLLAWKEGGITGAGNIFQVMFWLMYPLVTSVLFLALGEKIKVPTGHSAARWWYGRALSVTLFCLTAWYGHHVMAVLVLLCMLMADTIRNKTKQHKAL